MQSGIELLDAQMIKIGIFENNNKLIVYQYNEQLKNAYITIKLVNQNKNQ